MKNPKVSIIIVNFNGKRFLKKCLDSIFSQTYSNYEVTLVDNASTDGSAEFVEKNYPRVKLIKNDKNLGFAGGNNVGISVAFKDPDVKYVALLNNDTRVINNWLSELVKVAEGKKTHMVGSKILFPNGLVNSVGIIVRQEGEAEDMGFEERDVYHSEMEIFGPCAGAALYSRKLLEDIRMNGDYLDSDFFVYAEDVDLAFRARLMGYRCMFNPKAVVYHFWAGTAGRYSPISIYYGRRNRFYLLVKDYPTSILLKYLPRILMKEIAIFGLALIRGELMLTIRAKMDSLKNLQRMLGKRKIIQGRKKVTDKEIDRWLTPYPLIKRLPLTLRRSQR